MRSTYVATKCGITDPEAGHALNYVARVVADVERVYSEVIWLIQVRYAEVQCFLVDATLC
jgi:hypothetical protein